VSYLLVVACLVVSTVQLTDWKESSESDLIRVK